MFIPCLAGTLIIWTYSGYWTAAFNEVFMYTALFYNWSLSHKWWDIFERGRACGQYHLIGMLQDEAQFYTLICVTRKENCLVLYCAFTKSRRIRTHINITLGLRSCNYRCRGKASSIMYSDCEIVASVIQHVKRTSRIVVPSVACLELACFFTLFHER